MDKKTLVYEFDGGQEYKSLYEEAGFIMAYYNSILKNPRKKVHPILTVLRFMLIYGGVMFVCGLFIALTGFSAIISVALVTAGAIVFILFLKSYLAYKKFIEAAMTNNKHKIYTLSEEKLAYKDPEKEFSTEWDKIRYIVINKYTVCFLPSNLNGVLYAIPVCHADEVKEFMNSINKEDIIVDNR